VDKFISPCVLGRGTMLSRRVMYKWVEVFKNGHMSVTDTTATTAQNEERARELILQNRRVTVDKIAKELNISTGSAYSMMHDNYQFHKV
jgi:hypothetical protein